VGQIPHFTERITSSAFSLSTIPFKRHLKAFLFPVHGEVGLMGLKSNLYLCVYIACALYYCERGGVDLMGLKPDP